MVERKYRLCELTNFLSSALALAAFWGGCRWLCNYWCNFSHTLSRTHTLAHICIWHSRSLVSAFLVEQPSTFREILWENAISLSSQNSQRNNLFIACRLMAAIDNLISYNYYKLFCLAQQHSSSSSPSLLLLLLLVLLLFVCWREYCTRISPLSRQLGEPSNKCLLLTIVEQIRIHLQ